VDFQIPGSQVKRVIPQGTIPQPKTEFSSLDFVTIFSSFSSFFISAIFCKVFTSHFAAGTFPETFVSLNSFKVDQALQKPHCPAHFILSFQQSVHIYIIYFLKFKFDFFTILIYNKFTFGDFPPIPVEILDDN